MDISTYLTYLRGTAANPLTYKEIAGMPTDEAHENIFSNYYVLTNDTNMLRSFLGKTIKLVTYRAAGGNYQPVDYQTIDFENLTPLDLLLQADIIATEIEKYIQIMNDSNIVQRNYAVSGLAGVYNTKLETMLMTKQKMLISQENELLATGAITFPFTTSDGLIKAYQIDFTGIDGAIATRAYTDTGYHDTSSSSTTEVHVAEDVERLRKYGYTNSNGTLFKKNAPMVIIAGTTQYTNLIGKFSTTSLRPIVMTDDNVNYYIKLSTGRIPIIESGLTRQYYTANTTTGIATLTETDQLGAKEMLLVDNSRENFGFADLRFVNMTNLNGSAAARPYEVEFESMVPSSRGVTMFFSSRTMAFGRTKAVIKFTGQA